MKEKSNIFNFSEKWKMKICGQFLFFYFQNLKKWKLNTHFQLSEKKWIHPDINALKINKVENILNSILNKNDSPCVFVLFFLLSLHF